MTDHLWGGAFEVIVSTHNHVGHMTFGTTSASCSGCGQRWWLGQRGWTPASYSGPDGHPTGWTRQRRRT